MTTPKIFVQIDHNELPRPRAEKIEKAVLADERFVMVDPRNLPFDLAFETQKEQECHACDRGCGECLKNAFQMLHVELKDFSEDANSDYLASILNGHLWEQVLVARELQEPLVVVVLGDDNDVGAAIRKAASRESNGHQVDPEKLMQYFRMVEGFEANCIALGIQVWRLKTDPYKRMLLRVRKILEGGDLSGFAPAPANEERRAVGLSILAGKGIGPTKARAILEKFRVGLMPLETDSYLADCAGIGEKLADRILYSENIWINGGHIHRPKVERHPIPRKSTVKRSKAKASAEAA